MNSINPLEKTERTWILLAHRSGAKLFRIKFGADPQLLEEVEYPDGRLKNHDIETDDKGRRNSPAAGRIHTGGLSASPSHQQKGGMDKHKAAAAHVADIFAKQLAERLRKGRVEDKYERLILVAEPHFLGNLLGSLDKETEKKVVRTVKHNYIDLPKNDLREILKKISVERVEAA